MTRVNKIKKHNQPKKHHHMSYSYASTYSSTFPGSLGTITYNNNEYCVYADYYVF